MNDFYFGEDRAKNLYYALNQQIVDPLDGCVDRCIVDIMSSSPDVYAALSQLLNENCLVNQEHHDSCAKLLNEFADLYKTFDWQHIVDLSRCSGELTFAEARLSVGTLLRGLASAIVKLRDQNQMRNNATWNNHIHIALAIDELFRETSFENNRQVLRYNEPFLRDIEAANEEFWENATALAEAYQNLAGFYSNKVSGEIVCAAAA